MYKQNLAFSYTFNASKVKIQQAKFEFLEAIASIASVIFHT